MKLFILLKKNLNQKGDKMKRIALFTLVLLFFIGLVGCDKTPLTKINLAEVTHSIFYAPQYIAINQKFFEKEGLKVTLINAQGADHVMTSLLSKDVQIGLCGPEASIYVYINGEEDYAVNFIQLTQRDGSFIFGRSPIPNFDISMLKGKSILGGRKGGVPEMTLEYVIKQSGLTVSQNSFDGDVNVRVDVAFGAMAGAFVQGQGDFTTLFEPTATEIEREGNGYVLASVGQLSGEIPYTAYCVINSYYNQNQDILERFTRAIYQGQKFVQEKDDLTVAKALASFFPESSLEDLTSVVRRYRAIDAWCSTPFFKEDGFERLLDVMMLADELDRRVPYNTIVNNSIAEKIINEFKK